MTRYILTAVLFAGIFTIGIVFLEPSRAQTRDQKLSVPDQQDPEMALTIKRLTDRSTQGLAERKLSDGTIELDLEERFQNVPLARIDQAGDADVGCVTSLAEANDFFGRDLETGQIYPSMPEATDHAQSETGPHEMSVDEYEFYKKLIENATAQRLAYPETATLTIVNGDGIAEGFNDLSTRTPEGGNDGTTLGEQRLKLFNFAAGIWGAYLDSTVQTQIFSKFDPLTPCSTSGGVLGSAGATSIYRNFPGAEFSNTWYSYALANKIRGSDSNILTNEINATFNSDIDNGCLGTGTRFYYGLNNSTPSGMVNLLVVLLHEMGHGLGFQTYANGSTGALNGGFPDVYTRHMFDR
ncbi:MAG: hypothetical protein ABIV48_06675, partial [Pyrinomonadaceae bacterium]